MKYVFFRTDFYPYFCNIYLKYLQFSFGLVTTDSTTSEDDSIPPPLPAKTRDSNDYSNLPLACVNIQDSCGSENYSIVVGRWGNKPLPAEPICINNSSYDYVDAQTLIENRRRPPTPPPKPTRNSKFVPA